MLATNRRRRHAALWARATLLERIVFLVLWLLAVLLRVSALVSTNNDDIASIYAGSKLLLTQSLGKMLFSKNVADMYHAGAYSNVIMLVVGCVIIPVLRFTAMLWAYTCPVKSRRYRTWLLVVFDLVGVLMFAEFFLNLISVTFFQINFSMLHGYFRVETDIQFFATFHFGLLSNALATALTHYLLFWDEPSPPPPPPPTTTTTAASSASPPSRRSLLSSSFLSMSSSSLLQSPMLSPLLSMLSATPSTRALPLVLHGDAKVTLLQRFPRHSYALYHHPLIVHAINLVFVACWVNLTWFRAPVFHFRMTGGLGAMMNHSEKYFDYWTSIADFPRNSDNADSMFTWHVFALLYVVLMGVMPLAVFVAWQVMVLIPLSLGAQRTLLVLQPYWLSWVGVEVFTLIGATQVSELDEAASYLFADNMPEVCTALAEHFGVQCAGVDGSFESGFLSMIGLIACMLFMRLSMRHYAHRLWTDEQIARILNVAASSSSGARAAAASAADLAERGEALEEEEDDVLMMADDAGKHSPAAVLLAMEQSEYDELLDDNFTPNTSSTTLSTLQSPPH